ncbi:DNA-binding transcriptional ArsR family regulator [Actinomadura luteofluorescens]|uniref:DNA-binding transcriptional ArsR family regulator n=1 Tax=Actinomadura luteofluorescens TaxID=46163 RepID=A0A7Y9EBP2_9ACTN|nr:metalloregulator ArsR/SmtB family transcription factor [Actinomadura luteofluorescens]NYD44733.1 DNA-binding transcriptional ArsR family regulator [Actinomadura luteofluorescens]
MEDETPECCPPVLEPGVAQTLPARAGKPPLAERPLLDQLQASQLVVLFKVLGNDTRLRLLHALHRDGEVPVGELAEQVGMRPQAISNQLQRLTDRGMVAARRDGNRIFYSIADPCIPAVLDLALCLTEETAVAGDDPT